VDGTLKKDMPPGENWESLVKGGTAGMYVVVMALSWWINAIGPAGSKGEAWDMVLDVLWVLTQMHLTVAGPGEASESKGTKRGRRGQDVRKRMKKWVASPFVFYTG